MSKISNWKELENYINDIPQNVCGGLQPKYLYELSLKAGATGEIVEIGTNVGKSTIALAYAQKEKNGKPIHTIDIYQHPDIEKNLTGAGVENYVNRIVKASARAAAVWREPIELLWIDGDHACVGVKNDIKFWCRHVVEGGKVAFHDYPGHNYNSYWTAEVWRAVSSELLCKPWQWRIVADREVGSIIVFEKLGTEKPAIPISQIVQNFVYWRMRNMVSRIFRYFPNFSSNFVQRKMKKKYGSD